MSSALPRISRSALFLIVLCPLAGCGGDGRPDLVEVTGTVTLNGEPLEGALVSFEPLATGEDKEYQRPSRGETNAQGEFRLTTYVPDDGVPIGKYRVAVQKREMIGEVPEDFNWESADAPVQYRWITPRKLASPDTSGLEIEVTASGLEPPVLELTSDGPPEIERPGAQPAFDEP